MLNNPSTPDPLESANILPAQLQSELFGVRSTCIRGKTHVDPTFHTRALAFCGGVLLVGKSHREIACERRRTSPGVGVRRRTSGVEAGSELRLGTVVCTRRTKRQADTTGCASWEGMSRM